MKIKFILIVFLILNLGNLKSQEDLLFYNELIGINLRAGLTFNNYNLNFSSFEGAVDCGIFNSGNGFSYLGELSIEKAINENLQISLSGGYYDRSGKFAVNNTFESRDLNTNQVITVTAENSIETNLSYIEIVPEIKYVLIKNFINGPFRIGFGPRLSMPLIKQFTQQEKIISPSNAVFINSGGIRTQTRDLADGDISSINSMQYGLRFGIENLLKIGNDNYFTQSLNFDYNLSNVTDDADWKIWSVNLALGIRFSVKNPEPSKEPEIKYEQIEEEIIQKEPEVVVIEKPKPILEVKINDLNNLKIETGNELLSTIPLVNAVFFEQNTSDLSSFYNLNRQKELDLFYSDPIAMHSFVLQRIADIVNKNENSNIILQSSTSGQDESNDLNLSKKRAENVKNALINLGVPESKIKINSLINPTNLSNPDVAEGRAENRRVEVLVKNAPLQEYVNFVNYRELFGDINYSVVAENFENPKIEVNESMNNNKVNIDTSGNYKFSINKRLANNENNVNIKISSKFNDLTSTDQKNFDISNAEVISKDYNLDNFLAILLFDFNKSELSDENKALLKQLSEKLPQGATIELIGSADIIGTNEYNQELAKQRALNTEKYINQISDKNFKITTKTMLDKFDDTTPQGRYLNRSIKIRLIK